MGLRSLYLSPLCAPNFLASGMPQLCERPGCHSPELWNNSLREVRAWGLGRLWCLLCRD